MAKRSLSRRTFLRSATVAGVALALPPLELLRAPSRANAQMRASKLLIYQFPNGVFLPDWIPTRTGSDWLPSPCMEVQPGDPSTIGRDLASVRQHINIVSGLSNQNNAHDAHQSPNASFLTGTASRDSWRPTGPSLDKVVEDALGAGTHWPALRVSSYQNISYDDMSGTVCYDGSGNDIRPISSPRSLYGQMTGLVTPTGGPTQSSLPTDFRRSVLDFVREDAERLRSQCGIGDRRVLDQHFDSIRDIERRLDEIIEPVSCELPDLGTVVDRLPDPGPGAAGHWPNVDVERRPDGTRTASSTYPLRTEVMGRMAILALRCGLTRVAVVSLGPSSSRVEYPFLHDDYTDDHFYSHLQRDPLNRAKQEQWNQVTRWKMAQFSEVIERMAASDGTGASLLDDTIVIAGSELASGAAHTSNSIPIVVAGNIGAMASASGRNRHLAVPCDPAQVIFRNPDPMGGSGEVTLGSHAPGLCSGSGSYTPLSNLWLTVLRGLGVPATGFGDSTGTIDGLWT